MLQSDLFRERAEFSDLAHGQRNPGVMSLFSFRGCERLSKKPINGTIIGELRHTQTLINGFNMRAFPLLLEESSQNFWQHGKTSVSLNMASLLSKFFLPPQHCNADYMNSSFKVKVFFLLAVLSLGFFSSRK